MKKVSLDTWIQLLGMVGLLGGLVFVGLEMRQSQQIAIAGQVQARNEAFLNLYLTMMGEDPTGRSLAASGYLGADLDPSSLTSAEYDVWYAIKSWQVMSLQNADNIEAIRVSNEATTSEETSWRIRATSFELGERAA